MNLTSERIGDCLIIRVGEPRIDAAVAIRFKDRMRDLTADAATRTVLDLSQVDFIDSSGLGAIVAAMKQRRNTRCALRNCALSWTTRAATA